MEQAAWASLAVLVVVGAALPAPGARGAAASQATLSSCIPAHPLGLRGAQFASKPHVSPAPGRMELSQGEVSPLRNV